MKSNNKFSLALVAIIGSLVIAQPAAAGSKKTSNHHASICTTAAKDKENIQYLTTGIYVNTRTGLTCPLIRRTTKNKGAKAYFHVKHYGRETTSCLFYSYDKEGNLLRSDFEKVTGSGNQEIELDLKGRGYSDHWSTYSVHCFVPKFSTTRGIGLIEY